VKVWICRGEILETGQFYKGEEKREPEREEAPAARPRRRERGGEKRKHPRGRVRRPATVGEGHGGAPPKGRRPEPARKSETTGAKNRSAGKKADTGSSSTPKETK